MAVPIIFVYAVGIIFFILGIEGSDDKTRTIIYYGISIFANIIGYYLSYLDTDYTQAAYFPLVIGIISIIFAIYTAWQLLDFGGSSWDDMADGEETDAE